MEGGRNAHCKSNLHFCDSSIIAEKYTDILEQRKQMWQ